MDRLALIGRIAGEQDGIVTAAQAMAAGFRRDEIATLCRSGRWRRLATGVYGIRPAGLSRRASIRAAVASLGPRACAVLDTAAELYGIAGLRRTDRIHVCVPSSDARAQRPGGNVDVHQLVLQPVDVSDVDGIPVTTVSRTIADIVLRVPRYEAVCVLDSALNQKLITPDEAAEIPAGLSGRRGAVRARAYFEERDGRARSPLETRVRLRCVDGRVPPDEVGYVVRDDEGLILAEADLAWRGAKVIAEADGAGPHSLPEAVFVDRRRQNVLANAGWLVLRFTWLDTLHPGYIPDAVRQALRRRRQPR